jgi:hypothetical protein
MNKKITGVVVCVLFCVLLALGPKVAEASIQPSDKASTNVTMKIDEKTENKKGNTQNSNAQNSGTNTSGTAQTSGSRTNSVKTADGSNGRGFLIVFGVSFLLLILLCGRGYRKDEKQ